MTTKAKAIPVTAIAGIAFVAGRRLVPNLYRACHARCAEGCCARRGMRASGEPESSVESEASRAA
jgi:hypothetical protein